MTDNNLKFHYQTIKSDSINDEFTVHEAFSDVESGELWMVNPVPVFMVGDTKADLEEMNTTIDKDLETYGVVDIANANLPMRRYEEFTTMSTIDYSEDNIDDEQEEEDFYDDNDNVIDLVDFMNRNK